MHARPSMYVRTGAHTHKHAHTYHFYIHISICMYMYVRMHRYMYMYMYKDLYIAHAHVMHIAPVLLYTHMRRNSSEDS